MYKQYRRPNGDVSPNIILDVSGDGTRTLCIPNDPANTDWKEYQAWLADGNEPEAAE